MSGGKVFLRTLVLLLTIHISLQQNVNLACQTGWTMLDFNCYKLYTGIIPWDSAARVCKSYGSEMAKITDFTENQQVGMFAFTQGISKYWIGFTRQQAPQFNQALGYWSDGSQTNVAVGFWENNEPDVGRGKCVYVTKKMDRYLWSFGPCETKMAYICQRPACPTGTFHCEKMGECINPNLVCDGENDCGDYSDELDCANRCTYLIQNNPLGFIASPQYPSSYPHSTNCRWTIRVPLGQNAYIKFTNFSTEKNYDEVKILEGSVVDSGATEVASISGVMTGNLPTYTSSNNIIVVKFSTDSTINSTGFRLEYSGRSTNSPVEFRMIAVDSVQTMVPPDYPNNYLGSQDYKWIFTALRPTQIITLNIVEIDLKGEDALIIRDGNSVMANLLYTYTFQTTASDAPFLFSTGSSIYVYMKTRGYKVGRGYKLTYRQGCAMTLITKYGKIFSPGYPLMVNLPSTNYPNGLNCVYKVNVPNTNITLLNLETEFETESQKDIVTVNSPGGNLQLLTGTRSTLFERRSTGLFDLNFTTDAIIRKKGFMFTYSIDCPDPGLTVNSIMSPPNPTFRYGEVITVTCKPGYRFASQEFINPNGRNLQQASLRCMMGGKWNLRTTPKCQPVYCGNAPKVANAYLQSSVPQASSVGGSVTYACYPGFTMTNSATIRCLNNGTWETTPSCSIASCPSRTLPPVSGVLNVTKGDGTGFSSIITYTCFPGYQIVGKPIAFCGSNSQWSSPPPTCARLNCPTPVIKNGKLNRQDLGLFGDTRTVVCDVGYELIGGPSLITCQASQTYSNLDKLQCKDINECTRPRTRVCMQNCHNTVGSFTCSCNKGYSLMVDGTTCLDIPECRTNNGGCSQICKELPGSYSCSCNTGFDLFTVNGQNNFFIPQTETGSGPNDILKYNHTCVPVLCPNPATLANGFMLKKRNNYRYKGTIPLVCNIGYNLNGNQDRTCQANGQWGGGSATCDIATCTYVKPPGSVPPGTIEPTVSPTGPVNYLGYLTISCDIPGRGIVTTQRQCLWDPVSKIYKFYGAPVKCTPIDCGPPPSVAGATIPSGISTTYNSSFTFACKSQYILEGSSSSGNNVVQCKANGYWGLGTLRCKGQTCSDPGTPPGATQLATNYEEGQRVNFTCNRPGYTIVGRVPLQCFLNASGILTWDEKLPTCQDTQKPTFTNCDTTKIVDRHSVASAVFSTSMPVATDNTGIKKITVSPAWPSSFFYIDQPRVFTFEAEDFNGNKEKCVTSVQIKDAIPPTISCPTDITVTFQEETQFDFMTFGPSTGVVATDNNIAVPVTYNPPSLNVTARSVNIAQWVVATATDKAGNINTCRFQVVAKADICSPLALITPVNAQKSCRKDNTTARYDCTVQCNSNYAFYNQAPGAVISTFCVQGSTFSNSLLPACSSTIGELAAYTQKIRFNYTAQGTVDNNCRGDYSNVLQPVLDTVKVDLTNICTNVLRFPVSMTTTIANLNNDIIINAATRKVTVIVTLQYTGDQTTLLESCASMVLNILQDNNAKVTRLVTGESTVIQPLQCPQIRSPAGHGDETFKGFSCNTGSKKVNIAGVSACLKCPVGTYSTGVNCIPCRLGSYSDTEGATQCKLCASGRWTYSIGSTSSLMCRAECEFGTTSSTRLAPCTPCPLHTTAVNSTYCQPCGGNYITRETGATNPATQCKALCPIGTFNAIDGHENCQPCPPNTYQDATGQTQCKACGETELISSTGATSRSNCTLAAPIVCNNFCQNSGICRVINHSPVCVCPEGFFGETCQTEMDPCRSSPCYNNGRCTKTSATTYTCDCANTGASGLRCEVNQNDCGNNACQNDAMCQDILQGYRCLCKSGFTGSFCASQQSICQTQVCLNGGNCQAISSIWRECTCAPGFTGKSCETNIDDCASNPCLHGGNCTDVVNGFTCACPQGYSGLRCETRRNRCTGIDCGSNAVCVEDYKMDTYTCVCDPGYASQYGEYCEYKLMIGVRLQNLNLFLRNATSAGMTLAQCKMLCDAEPNKACKAFTFIELNTQCYLHGTNTASTSTTVDEQAGTSHYLRNCWTVTDTPPAFYQISKLDTGGFYTQWYNSAEPKSGGNYIPTPYLKNTLQLDICAGTMPVAAECRELNTTGAASRNNITCNINGLVCVDSAQSGGKCFPHEIRFKCSTRKIFKSNTCIAPNRCNPSPCNQGTCQQVNPLSFQCSCNPGMGGSLCQNNVNNCVNNLCGVNGKCIDGMNSYTCQCAPGFTGNLCQTPMNFCASASCNATGTNSCQNNPTGAQCLCKPGYEGTNCDVNINECVSNPCLNAGQCVDGINDFSCVCTAGWTGKRCETLIKPCNPTPPCINSASCFNLFNDYYCQCQANTYGKNCEHAPSVCSNANPCVTGNCTEQSGNAKCQCGPDYTGPGCGILVDHCNIGTCMNGGTCSVTSINNYKCTCPPGFTGKNCEQNINDCAGVTCPGTSVCIDGVNTYFCRCSVGYSGNDCSQLLDRNYDMLFDLPDKTNKAYLPYPIQLSGNKLSVSLWVRFLQKGGTGTFFSMFTVKDANSLLGKKELIRIDHKGVTLSIDGNPSTVILSYFPYDDGKWHQITLTWNGDTGLLSFIVNTIAAPVQNYGMSVTLKGSVWVVLGCKYDPVKEMPIPGEGFNGWISQVSIYNRDLTFNNEIPLKLENPRMYFHGEILAWNEFRWSRGVNIVIPSTASINSCPWAYSGTNCTVVNEAKLKVKAVSCPADVIKHGLNRITKVTWPDPVFQGAASNVIFTHTSGDVFIWGRYLVAYQATNGAGNKGLCTFKIFVQYTNCPKPADPYRGTTRESKIYSPWITSNINCNAGYKVIRDVPRLYTCPRIGTYNPMMIYNTFRLPPCGQIINNPLREVFLELSYQMTSTYCTGIKTTMEIELLKTVQGVHGFWGLGLCQKVDCSDAVIVVSCGNTNGRKKRQLNSDVKVQITLPRARALVTATNASFTPRSLTPQDALRLAVLGQNEFDYRITIPNATPIQDLLKVLMQLSCDVGQAVVQGECVKCAPGTYYNMTTKTCLDCPVGQYQPSSGATNCLPCTGTLISELPGSPAATDCKPDCGVGYYFDLQQNLCAECSVGFYQNQTGMFYCYPCSVEKTTSGKGSTSISDCFVGCGQGQQLVSNGTCEPCPLGKYRSAVDPTCQDCAPGFTTVSTGAISSSQCNVGNCQPGYFRGSADPKICHACLSGTYQDQKHQSNCKSCGNSTLYVSKMAATSITDCRLVCPSGQHLTGLTTCTTCPVGTYRNKTVNPNGACQPCSLGTTTPSAGATDASQCSIVKCPVGYQANAAKTGCTPCAKGSFQDKINQPACIPCGTGLSTRQAGANSSALCESYCSGGYEKLTNGTCKPCDIGYYKDNAENMFGTCSRCPDPNMVTATTATDSKSKCTVRNCASGYKRNASDTGCDPCPFGTYQPAPYQKTCLPCQGQTWTKQTASTSASQCEAYCNPGFEAISPSTTCTPCSRGYYKDNVSDRFGQCLLCANGLITPTTGATSDTQCTVANCTAGQQTVNNQCIDCLNGFYQPQKWQNTCQKCPIDKTTVSTKSTSPSDCILSCPPGKEDISGVCQSCKVGFFKSQTKAAPCTACATNTTTFGTGSTSAGACSIVGCPPGTKRMSTTTCQTCDYGQYQPLRWQVVCLTCDSGATTLQKGSTNKQQCVDDCPKGEQYSSAKKGCEKCPVGFYQDKLDPAKSQCIMCPIPDFITGGTGATAIGDCTVRNCTTPGQYLNSSQNQCQDCGIGYFQDQKWQTSCKKCLPNYTTRTIKSPSIASCVRDCPKGTQQIGDKCNDCGTGRYRDGSTWDCQPCPNGLSTTSLTAASITDCDISPCQPGNYFSRQDGRCLPCPIHTYQASSSAFGCDNCPPATFTSTTGMTKIEDCKGYCGTVSNCSVNATCTPDIKNRFNCTCKQDYVGNGFLCTHKCDTNYCLSGSTCQRANPARCDCTEFYTGPRCNIRRPAEQVSAQTTLTIVGIVVGVLGFLLLLILIAVCVYRSKQPPSPKEVTDYDDRTSFARGPYDQPLTYVPSKPASVISGPAYMLPRQVEKNYDNPLYVASDDDPAVYKA